MGRKNMGRALITLAGGGCLGLAIFVVAPMLNRPVAPVTVLTPEEIVGEVAGTVEQEGEAGTDEAGFEDGTEVPSPLVAVSHAGDELPVIFRAQEWVRVASAPEVETPDPEGGEEVEAAAPPEGNADTEAEAGTVDAAAADVECEGTTEAAEVEEEGTEVEAEAAEVRTPAAGDVQGEIDVDGEALETEPVVVKPDDEAVDTETETAAAQESADARVVEAPLPPTDVETRVPREASEPSGEPPQSPAPGAGQAGRPKSGLPPHGVETDRGGVVVPGTLRGVMGYRLPLVSRQEVPDQIVSGVLIPAHTTFVILRQGWWELVGMSDEEIERLRELEKRQAAAAAQPEPEAEKPGWRLLRMFRRRAAPAGD